MPLNDTARRHMLSEQLSKMELLLTELQHITAAEKQLLPVQASTSAVLSTDFVKTAIGKLISLERLILAYSDTNNYSRREVFQDAIHSESEDSDGIRIQRAENLVIIRMPYLPRRNTKNTLILDALAAKIMRAGTLPKWSSCTISFIHVFPASTRIVPRDNDNYEYKRAIDLIAYALGCSDCPITMDLSMRTVFTDELQAGTYIEISPKSLENSVLPNWVS